MKTLTLNYDNAHSFVESNKHRGYLWNGWTIERWVPNPSGYMSSNGAFKNGKWGLKFSYPVSPEGIWEVKAPDNVQYN